MHAIIWFCFDVFEMYFYSLTCECCQIVVMWMWSKFIDTLDMENYSNLLHVNCPMNVFSNLAILNFSDKLKDEVFIYGVEKLILLLKLNKPFKNPMD